MGILQGSSGADAEFPFAFYDASGNPILAHVFNNVGGGLTDEVKVRLPGGVFTNATIANIVEWGQGIYALRLTATETAVAGKAGIHALRNGGDGSVYRHWETIDPLIIYGINYVNSMLDNCSYNASNMLTSGRIRVFISAAALAAASPGAGDGVNGEVYRFTITAVDGGGGKPSSYKMSRTL